MGLQIQDGKGRGLTAEVNTENQLVVRAISEPELEHAASFGKAYAWDSLELDIDTGDTMLFIKNTGSTTLILDRIIFNGSNVICTWTVLLGTATTTPSGTAVAGVNLNTGFASVSPDTISLSDETAVADGSIIARVKTPVSGHEVFDATGIILAKNHYIQVNQITESTSGSVIIVGHFQEPS
jgi:hypothetical protein